MGVLVISWVLLIRSRLQVLRLRAATTTKVVDKKEFLPISHEGSRAVYELEVVTEFPGSLQLGARIFPKNALLPHRQDFALVKWL